MSRRRRRSRSVVESSMAPFVDLVFQLLIFFFVADRFDGARAIDVNPPQGKGSPSEIGSSVIVAINREGRFLLEGNPRSAEEVREQLRSRSAVGIVSVLVHADGRADVQSLVTLRTICRELQIESVQLSVQEPNR